MKRDLTALEQFLIADEEEKRFELLRDPATRADVEGWMGAPAFREYVDIR